MAPAVTEGHARLKAVRRKLARTIIRQPKQGPDPAGIPPSARHSINRVLVLRPVHSLGNLLGLTPMLTEMEAILPGAEIDILAGVPVITEICRHFGNVNETILLPRHAFRAPVSYVRTLLQLRSTPYDLVLDPASGSNTSQSLAALVNTPYLISAPDAESGPLSPEMQHFAMRPVEMLRRALPWAESRRSEHIPRLNLRLQSTEIELGRKTLERIRRQNDLKKPATIAIFTHATWKKAYPRVQWQGFLSELAARLPNHDFIEILPAHGESRLDFSIPTYFSSNIRKLGGVLHACAAYIGADSGVMHLASAAGTRAFGLFSVTDVAAWRPYGQGDLAIETTSLERPETTGMIVSALATPSATVQS